MGEKIIVSKKFRPVVDIVQPEDIIAWNEVAFTTTATTNLVTGAKITNYEWWIEKYDWYDDQFWKDSFSLGYSGPESEYKHIFKFANKYDGYKMRLTVTDENGQRSYPATETLVFPNKGRDLVLTEPGSPICSWSNVSFDVEVNNADELSPRIYSRRITGSGVFPWGESGSGSSIIGKYPLGFAIGRVSTHAFGVLSVDFGIPDLENSGNIKVIKNIVIPQWCKDLIQ